MWDGRESSPCVWLVGNEFLFHSIKMTLSLLLKSLIIFKSSSKQDLGNPDCKMISKIIFTATKLQLQYSTVSIKHSTYNVKYTVYNVSCVEYSFPVCYAGILILK